MAVAIGLVGGVMQAIGASKQAKASEKAEKARQRMMQLEAMRKRREMIREATVARAQATSNATAQGAGEGSGLQGGIAQITSRQNRNVQASNQDEALGNKVFSANRDYAKAGSLIAFGGGISSLGNALGSFG